MTLSVVVGLGRSGIGAARLLKAQGSEVVVLEKAESDACRRKSVGLRQRALMSSSDNPWRSPVSRPGSMSSIRW